MKDFLLTQVIWIITDKIHDSKNVAKQNYCESPCPSSIIKCLKDFEKMTCF